MSEKKEVFDYLRNKQKAAEIEAKVNGINLWVLLGAVGFVSWQLVGSVNSDIWGHHETLLQVLMFAQAIYLFNWASRPTGGIRDDVRYSSVRLSEISAPFLRAIEGLLLLVPPALFFLTIEKTLAAGFLTLFGLLSVITSIVAIGSQFGSEKVEAERFPKPSFGITRKAHITTGIVFIGCFLLVAADQVVALLAQVNLNSAESIRSLGLMATLYLLILVALQRTAQNHGLHWTYELETDLLLGSVSPDAALRRIEHLELSGRVFKTYWIIFLTILIGHLERLMHRSQNAKSYWQLLRTSRRSTEPSAQHVSGSHPAPRYRISKNYWRTFLNLLNT